MEPAYPTISREQFLAPWPRSKAGNEWIRIDGVTYAIKSGPEGNCMVIVYTDRTRVDVEVACSPEELKAIVWPETRDGPLGKDELP